LPSSLGDLTSLNTFHSSEHLTQENTSTQLKLVKAEKDTLCDTVDTLKKAVEQKYMEIDTLNSEKNIAVHENKKIQKFVDASKQENERIIGELESLKKDWKALNRAIKQKEKELHDLIKDNTKVK
jgi:chromosome segregation ATPase